MDLGPHAHFIVSSYAIVASVLVALIAWLIYDGLRQQQILSDLEDDQGSKNK